MYAAVGCEADAVAFTEEAQVTDGLLHTVAPDGSYVAGKGVVKARSESASDHVRAYSSSGSCQDKQLASLGVEEITV